MKTKSPEILLDEKALNKTLDAMAEAIAKELGGEPSLVLIGIRTRGVFLAQRLQEKIKKMTKKSPPIGTLDITLYRDDFSTLAKHPIVRPSSLPFDVEDKKVVLVDDVLYTGRTIRAALDQIVDFGRPALVKLAALVDRGWREYPIQADYVGLKLTTKANQTVQVRLAEIDGEEKVILVELPNNHS
ncbi:MAG TPA: bifunctional pyr operon transcriptional regulator/uracil phosphoribosyltransferase PyrR [Candidatus Sumerlaeota bacterium]|nr:MAG: Bifunctional protein PyrR [candidate division BRC1 bacterium ADurb.Bin183]HOE63897.1 bifunctional pyr operon transcriptional regulator/uracil phosphoribosyltransferase PyrR [Candidatus Sumerlaeota bacterium]HRR31585.1 bifunctional pyr operon transcriptional regulator/uracil phosphoribosyltransferase PyrR [Candidatus Sumerlaeia bacterium]HON51183.1 bifunctional pyr operon transcriptional regulator/uracil phosphoribosyltransferase PyrR [Candidatus Sumerlaeota bacterium]HOR64500.1 bifuncti